MPWADTLKAFKRHLQAGGELIYQIGSENTVESTVEKSPKIHLLWETFQLYFGVFSGVFSGIPPNRKYTPKIHPQSTLTERVLDLFRQCKSACKWGM